MKNFSYYKNKLSLLILVINLAACGGGGGSGSVNPTSSSSSNSSSTSASGNAASSGSTSASSSSSSSSASSASSGASGSVPTFKADQPIRADVSGTGPVVGLAPLRVAFNSRKSNFPSDSSVSWDFGDGTRSDVRNPFHIYSAAGTYSVSFNLIDKNGNEYRDSIAITVINNVDLNGELRAKINASEIRGDIPLTVNLSAENSIATNKIVSYEWDFGSGVYDYGSSISRTFTEAKEHSVVLRITDEFGKTAQEEIQITSLLTVPKGNPVDPSNYQTDGNPFTNSAFYVSPDIEKLQNQSLAKIDKDLEPDLYNDIKFVQQMPSAVWLDRTIAIYGGDDNAGRLSLAGHLDEAVKQQQALAVDGKLPPMTAVIIVYNLPDRDCAALASNGLLNETNDANGDGEPDGTGMQEYREKYIDVIANIFSQYPTLRIVAMLEPDGYPNMITNVGIGFEKCDKVFAAGVYEKALQYAIAKFAPLDNVYTYLDIGHSGWLGWSDNLFGAIRGFTNLVADATPSGDLSVIRGFASNTSGYTPLDEPFISSSYDARQRLAQYYEWNQYVDEHSFIDALYRDFTEEGFSDNLGFIIDTARNGWGGEKRPTGEGAPASKDDEKFRIDLRKHRGHWCNVADAGIGEIPQANPDPSRPYLDAYFWMKPPGESDGISDPTAIDPNDEGKSYDPMCGGESSNLTRVAADVLQDAPHAGHWFHEQFVMLINNAYPPLGLKQAPGSTRIATFQDDFDLGRSPMWGVVADGEGTVGDSDELFFGVSGQSVEFSVSSATQHNDSVGSLELDEGALKGAASNMFGRVRIMDKSEDVEEPDSWVLVNAVGAKNALQLHTLSYRLGIKNQKLTAFVDSDRRGPTCEIMSDVELPKDQWSCLEWNFNTQNNYIAVWLDGEKIAAFDISEDADKGCEKQSWIAPDSWKEFTIGVSKFRPHHSQQSQSQEPKEPVNTTVFLDDFAVGTERLYCKSLR